MSSSRKVGTRANKKSDTTEKKKLKPVAATLPPVAEKEFTADDFKLLAVNEHGRYLPNSESIGHAILKKRDDNQIEATQYTIPHSKADGEPEIRPLINIEQINRFGQNFYQAESPKGKRKYYSTRSIHAVVGDDNVKEEIDIAYFSADEKGKEPFWGSAKKIPMWREGLSQQELSKLNGEKSTNRVKCGKPMTIHHESVRTRDGDTSPRNPTQNVVMGNQSAKDAYDVFYTKMTNKLSPEMKVIFKRAIEADIRNAFHSNYRPEWLHGEGYSLTPTWIDPQRVDNLAAAPKWANTAMMVLERIVKWFAMNRPNSFLEIDPIFKMLHKTELAEHIFFNVTVAEQNRFITFLQDLDPFKKFPLFSKASDLAQGTAITHSILQGVKPASQQIIKSSGRDNMPKATKRPSSTATMLANTRATKRTKLNSQPTVSKFPTHFTYERSVVKVYTTSKTANYDKPWMGADVGRCTGTGLVIEENGKKYILTNAHCVENQVVVRVRLANDSTRYVATPKCVSYQCDLALLEVSDPKFHELALPSEIGDMVKLEDKVKTVGFPMGGNEISVSKGVVSRIEVRRYCMSDEDMLSVQIDAAVNSGNSGGPVYCESKAVGIAFQGYNLQGLGYMIPAPIMKHFIQEALNHEVYRGFPILPADFQQLNHKRQRKYYGLKNDQTGIRINKLDKISDAAKQLHVDDILIEIESMIISNKGTVDLPGVGNLIDILHVTHMKNVGDTVRLKVLRKNKQNGATETHTLDVTLDHVPHETQIVTQSEHDKMPTFYIASGIAFAPLTQNYLDGEGAELADTFLEDAGCYLPEAPKKSDDEQLVVIIDMLDCKETAGYGEHVNKIVKEINGKKITNIHDVVEAIESNDLTEHCITVSSNNKIIVKNMTPEKHDKILKLYSIHSDRSEDLMPDQDLASQLSDESSSTIELSPSGSEAEESDCMESENDDESGLTLAQFTGYTKFQQKIGEMENIYSALAAAEKAAKKKAAKSKGIDYIDQPDEENETPDDDYEDDHLIQLSDESSNEEENVQKTSKITRLADHSRLFKKSRDEEDNKIVTRSHKRARLG